MPLFRLESGWTVANKKDWNLIEEGRLIDRKGWVSIRRADQKRLESF